MSIPAWLLECYAAYGSDIYHKGYGRVYVESLYGINKYKAMLLVRHVRTYGPPTKEDLKNAPETPSPPDPPEEDDITEEVCEGENVLADSYYYDTAKDKYLTFIKSSAKPLVTSGEVHRDIVRAYSNWNGKYSTIGDLSLKHQIPKQLLTEYLKAHQITHSHQPCSTEELDTKTAEELAAENRLKKKQLLQNLMMKDQNEDQKRDAEKWNKFEHSVLDPLLTHIKEHGTPYTVPKLILPKTPSRHIVVTSAQDFHWGGYGWVNETGESYNREVARERLFDCTANLISRLPGQPEKIVVGIGGDWFHVDGDHATTTKGTPQDTDGSPGQILITGCEVAREYIDLLRQAGPVELRLMSGNHDRSNSLSLTLYLQAWYRSCPDVTVEVNPRTRQYVEWEQNLICLTHGDTLKKNDTVMSVMASEAREAWGRTKNKCWFSGHYHHEKVIDSHGITHYQLPSLAAADNYHARHGYTTARKGMTAYVVDEQEGVINSIFAAVKR